MESDAAMWSPEAEEFFEGGTLRAPRGFACETWADAHDEGARALDLRAEAMSMGRWRSALAVDVQRMTEIALRVALAAPPHAEAVGAFEAAEHALASIPDDARLKGTAPVPVSGVVRRVLASRPTDARTCARLASWLCRWASECVDVLVTRDPRPLVSPHPTLRAIASTLRDTAAMRSAVDEPGAAHVEAIARFLVAQLERADGAPFAGVDLPAWAEPRTRLPSAGRAARGALSAPVRELTIEVSRVADEDVAGAALLLVARRLGWGPNFGDDPTETPWRGWYFDALDRCRSDPSVAASPRAEAAHNAVRVALRELGHDADRATQAARKTASRRNGQKRRERRRVT